MRIIDKACENDCAIVCVQVFDVGGVVSSVLSKKVKDGRPRDQINIAY